MNKDNFKHILVNPSVPDDVAYIPWMMSGETALLLNLNRLVRVIVDNSVVDPEKFTDDSIVVGAKVSYELGIDCDSAGDVVCVYTSDNVISPTNKPGKVSGFKSAGDRLNETIKDLERSGQFITKIQVNIETIALGRPEPKIGEMTIEFTEAEAPSVDRDKYVNIGCRVVVEKCASFNKCTINVLQPDKQKKIYSPMSFGLYTCFTVMTQHIYGSKDDIMFILGVMASIPGDNEGVPHSKLPTINLLMEDNEKYEKIAEEETIIEARRICNSLGIKVGDDLKTYKEFEEAMVTSGLILAGNYFWEYKRGKKLLHVCEDISIMLDSTEDICND